MKYEIVKSFFQEPLGSPGSRVSRPYGGLLTPSTSSNLCINSDLSISQSATASNKDSVLESLVDNVCLAEMDDTLDIHNIENHSNRSELPFKDSYFISRTDNNINFRKISMDEDSLFNSSPGSPAFYSSDFTYDLPDNSSVEVLDDLNSFVDNDAISSPGKSESQFISGFEYSALGNTTVDDSLSFNGINDGKSSSKVMDSLYRDLPLLSIPEDGDIMDIDESLLSPLSEDHNNHSTSYSPETKNIPDSFFDISSFNLSDINDSLDLFQDNIIEQALQDIDFDKNNLDSDITETVNSFLKTEESTSNDLENNSEVDRDSKNIPVLDPILKAFMFTYGEENKPRILKNVKILTSQRKNLPSSGHFSSTNIEDSQVKSPVIVKPEASLPSVTKCSDVNSFSFPMQRNVKTSLVEYPSVSVRKEGNSSSVNTGHHKKRTRMSLQGLSDAEKYLRIRSQNNVASKKCREKKKQQLHHMQFECLYQEELNEKLKKEHLVLTERRDKWKELFMQCNS